MSMPHHQRRVALVDLPYMAVIVLWVVVWETMAVLVLLNHRKSPRDLVVGPLADPMTHLAEDHRTKDRISNIIIASRAISLAQLTT